MDKDEKEKINVHFEDVYNYTGKGFVLYGGGRNAGKTITLEELRKAIPQEKYKREVTGIWPEDNKMEDFDWNKWRKDMESISTYMTKIQREIEVKNREAKEHWLIQDIIYIYYNHYKTYKDYIMFCEHFNSLLKQAEEDNVKLPRRDIIKEESFNYILGLREGKF